MTCEHPFTRQGGDLPPGRWCELCGAEVRRGSVMTREQKAQREKKRIKAGIHYHDLMASLIKESAAKSVVSSDEKDA